MKGTISPSGPSIEPSEPEKEIRFIEKIIESIPNPDVPKVISIQSAHDYISSAGLAVDEEGFIVDSESGDYVEPYAFSRDAFMDSTDVADNPFDEYFVPLSETSVVKNVERTHLTDVHTIHTFNGDVHPVKDDVFNLSRMARNIGITFSVVTAWSDSIHFVTESEVVPIYWEKDSDEDMILNCFGSKCGYSGPVTEWNEDDESRLICPECSALWDTGGVLRCSYCEATHQFEDVNIGEYSGIISCPDCDNRIEHDTQKSRYDVNILDIQ